MAGASEEGNGAVRAMVDDEVRSGRLVPGAKLPTERALAAGLGLSRAAVRVALGALEREGLVTRHVGRGTFLADPSSSVPRDDDLQTSPAEIMDTRLVIEPELAAIAARHATPEDLRTIRWSLDRGAHCGNHEEFESWDSVLHRAVAQAAHNALLLRMFDTMNTARELPVWGNIKRRSASRERRAGYQAAHAEIVQALVDRDPAGARTAMRRHLVDVRDNLLGRDGE